MGISYGDWKSLNDKLDAVLIFMSRAELNIVALTLKQEQTMATTQELVALANTRSRCVM